MMQDLISIRKMHVLGLLMMYLNVASDDLYQKIEQKFYLNCILLINTEIVGRNLCTHRVIIG